MKQVYIISISLIFILLYLPAHAQMPSVSPSGSTNFCSNGSNSFTYTVSGVADGTPRRQSWEVKNDMNMWEDLNANIGDYPFDNDYQPTNSNAEMLILSNFTMAGTWEFRYNDDESGGNGVSNEVTLVVTSIGFTVTASAAKLDICQGEDIQLQSEPTGAQYSYTWTGPGINGSNQNLQNPIIPPGAYNVGANNYSVTVTDGTCEDEASVTVNVGATPAPPVSGGDQTECAQEPVQTLTATASSVNGTSVVWYEQASGGSPIVGQPTFSMIGIKSYFAESVDDVTGCVSDTRTIVTLEIKALPIINPVTQIDQECSPDNLSVSLTVTTVNTQNNSDLTISDGGATVTGGPTSWTITGITPGSSPTLTATNGGDCEVERQIQIIECACTASIPTPTSPLNEVICENEPNPTFMVSVGAGLEARWYDNAVGGSILSTGLSFQPNDAAVGMYDYFVEAYDPIGDCASDRLEFTLTINALPNPNAVSNSPVCTGENIELGENGQGAISWSWTGPNSFSSSLQIPNPIPNATPAMDGIYTVVVENSDGCEASATVDVTVNESPTISPILETDQECANDLLSVTISVSTQNADDLSTIPAATIQQMGSNWTISGVLPGSSLTIIATNNEGCEAEVVVNVIDCDCSPSTTPDIPTSNNVEPSICVGDTNPILEASVDNGETVDWYANATGGTVLQNGSGTTTYQPEDTNVGVYTYYAEARDVASAVQVIPG